MTEGPESDRTPPQDVEAEQAALGAALLSRAAYLRIRRIISDDDWYRPAHAMIWRAIDHLQVTKHRADAVTVAAELVARGEMARAGGHTYLHTLISGVPTAANGDYYAEIVVERAVLRRVVEAGVRIQQMGYGAASGAGLAGTVDDVVERARSEVLLMSQARPDDGESDVDVLDLMDEHLPLNYVIPGLLSEAERLVFTAGEGLGKSTLIRQMLVCAAAGLHPFTLKDMEPVKCMGFDYENGRRLSQDRYGPLLSAAAQEGHAVEPGMLRLTIEPRGVNLLSPASAAKVLRQVERFQPAIVMIGPIYRLHESDPNNEQDARRITVVLDQIREICGAAVVTEAHMAKGQNGHRSLKPVGSGLWLRWPEYGYGLVLAEGSDLAARMVEVEAWRGPRDERAWPTLLGSGYAVGRLWPWVAIAQDRWRGLTPPDDMPEAPDF